MSDPISVEINDVTVDQILEDPNMRRAFPFFATHHAQKNKQIGGCGGCSRQKARINAFSNEVVKTAIANMTIDDKVKFKEMMNARQIEVKYHRPEDGKNIKLRF